MTRSNVRYLGPKAANDIANFVARLRRNMRKAKAAAERNANEARCTRECS